MKRICYLYTDFQRLVFNAALREAGLCREDFGFIVSGYAREATLADPVRLRGGCKGFQLRNARRLIAEIHAALDRLTAGEAFELWLASDNSGIGQVLIHHANCRRVILFEDGLANYGSRYPVFSKKMLRIVLFRLRNFLFLYPYCRPPMRAGDTASASRRYALTDQAFKGYDNVVVIARNRFLEAIDDLAAEQQGHEFPKLSSDDILFIDPSKDAARAKMRRPLILALLKEIIRREGSQRILVRPHPGARDDFISQTIHLLNQELEVPVFPLTSRGSLEVLLKRLEAPGPVIAGLHSSALYVARLITLDSRVYCCEVAFGQPIFSPDDRQLESLKKLGVQFV